MLIFLKANEDLDHLIGSESSEEQILFNQFRETFAGKFEPTFHIEPGLNIKLLLQQLDSRPFPVALRDQNIIGSYYQAQFHSPLIEAGPDVILLSIKPDLTRPIWQHKTEGFYFTPKPGWEKHWTQSQQAWLVDEFEPVGLSDANQFETDLLALVSAYQEQMGAAVLVINASTIDPNDNLYTYRNLKDSLPLRTHRFNLALLRVSMQTGISIVDVDRLVAEVGAAHVFKPLHYTDNVIEIIGQEIIRIIEDLGLLDGDQHLYRLEMPYVDLMVKEGVVSTWHKNVGESVKVGDKLVDVEAQFRKLQRTQSALHLSRGKSSKAGGKMEKVIVQIISANNGVLREIHAQPGGRVKVGTLMASVTNGRNDQDEFPQLDVKTAAKFRVTVHKLNIGKEK